MKYFLTKFNKFFYDATDPSRRNPTIKRSFLYRRIVLIRDCYDHIRIIDIVNCSDCDIMRSQINGWKNCIWIGAEIRIINLLPDNNLDYLLLAYSFEVYFSLWPLVQLQ